MKWSSSLSALVASTAVLVSASPLTSEGEPLRLYKLRIVA